MPRLTKAKRDEMARSAAAAAAAARALDPIDRELLNLEHMLPGPHNDALGINVEEYAARVRRLLDDPDALSYARSVLERLRRER
jgi:hypothetical protein